MIRVLLIGCGEHARHSHVPALARLRDELDVQLVAVVDLPSRHQEIRAYLGGLGMDDVELLAADPAAGGGALTPATEGRLTEARARLDVQAVIISTEPLAHRGYLTWALRHDLAVLTDKPVVLREGLATDPAVALALRADMDEIAGLYEAAVRRSPRCVVSVLTHRRANPVFQRVRASIEEVYRLTGCPVTSVVAEHSDGEWRMPWELRDQTYHPLNTGYGALSHSGYHVLDVATWLTTPTLGGLALDENSLAVGSWFSMPEDFVTQLTPEILTRVFGPLPADTPSASYFAEAGHFGEVDLHALARVRRGERVVSTMALHILHSSYSNRGWLSNQDRNLYWGNGRASQEIYSIQQGPFQTIKIVCLQGGEQFDDVSLYEPGGPRNCEAHVFRNTYVLPDVERHEHIRLEDHEKVGSEAGFVGPGKEAMIREFLGAVEGTVHRTALVSDLDSHLAPMYLLSRIYESWASGRASAGPS